jgi:hypothetical protein
VLDWFSRRVLSWRVSITMHEVLDARHGYQAIDRDQATVHGYL